MEHGADPYLVGQWRKWYGTALDMAKEVGCKEIVNLVRNKTKVIDSQ